MTTELDYSDLVNPRRVRSTIRRSFRGHVGETIGELLQNSQRAGARSVRIEAEGSRFVFADDGHGVAGLDGFYAMLRIAESRYDREEVAAQDPMGVGLSALLAHPQVSRVTFASGGLELSLDTEAWWTDPDYYETWAERVVTLAEPVAGLSIEAEADARFAASVVATLQEKGAAREGESPARGYRGVLDVALNGEAVDTSLPWRNTHGAPVLTGAYEGCPYTVSLERDKQSCAVWYGQVIPLERGNEPKPFGPFTVVLDVRSGRPVNPMAPTRAGVIRDARWAAFAAHVRDEIFARLLDPARRAELTPQFVDACYALDSERARRESPVFTASPYRVADRISSFDDVAATGPARVFEYADAPSLVEHTLYVLLPAEDESADEDERWTFGLDAFIPLLAEEPWRLGAGDPARLRVASVAWRPGAHVGDFFYEAGEWAVRFEGEPVAWRPVELPCVWAFENTADWNVEDAEWIVFAADRIRFYQHEAWAAFDPTGCDGDYDDIRRSYDNDLDDRVRALLGPSVSYDFTLSDLGRFVEGAVESVRVLREKPGERAYAVEVVGSAGDPVRLLLYG